MQSQKKGGDNIGSDHPNHHKSRRTLYESLHMVIRKDYGLDPVSQLKIIIFREYYKQQKLIATNL